jgi:hypothetical protein
MRKLKRDDPARWSSAVLPPIAPRCERAFALEIRIRGQVGSVYVATCTGLEHAVRLGEASFPAFESRNPRSVQDSLQRKILVLLDSETEAMRPKERAKRINLERDSHC